MNKKKMEINKIPEKLPKDLKKPSQPSQEAKKAKKVERVEGFKELFWGAKSKISEEAQKVLSRLTREFIKSEDPRLEKEIEQVKSEEEKFRKTVDKVEKIANEIISGGFEREISEEEKKFVKSFDPLLEPVKAHVAGINSVAWCKHPEYGDVVFKYQSNKRLLLDHLQERDLLLEAKEEKINNVVEILDTYENEDGEKAFITKRINGVNITEIHNKKEGFSFDGKGNILYKDKIITTEKEVQEKLSEAVKKLHAKDRAGFDIRSDNVLITPEGEPYLFDFDVQFSKKVASGELPDETLLRKALRGFLFAPKQVMSSAFSLVQYPLALTEGFSLRESKDMMDETLGLPVKREIESNFKEYVDCDNEDIENLFKRNYSASLQHNLLNRLPTDPRWR